MALNITFRQLRVFESVAKHSSFTRAAEALHLTQPAVSMQIKQLEEHVGLPLFDNIGKKVFLTEAGKAFFEYSKSISQQLDEAEKYIESVQGVHRGHLNLMVASTANYFATNLLATFIRRHPEITFSLSVTNRKRILQSLADNEPDLVIMGQPPFNLDVVAEAFLENPLVVIAEKNHPLTKRKRKISPVELLEESFVMREPGSGTRTAMERFFSDRGLSVEQRMQFGSNEAIKQAVQAGLGLAVVSAHTIQLEQQANMLKVLDVAEFPIRRQWHLVYRKGKYLSPVVDAFRQFVLEEGTSLSLNTSP